VTEVVRIKGAEELRVMKVVFKHMVIEKMIASERDNKTGQ
jgi:hypothetical protein